MLMPCHARMPSCARHTRVPTMRLRRTALMLSRVARTEDGMRGAKHIDVITRRRTRCARVDDNTYHKSSARRCLMNYHYVATQRSMLSERYIRYEACYFD